MPDMVVRQYRNNITTAANRLISLLNLSLILLIERLCKNGKSIPNVLLYLWYKTIQSSNSRYNI